MNYDEKNPDHEVRTVINRVELLDRVVPAIVRRPSNHKTAEGN